MTQLRIVFMGNPDFAVPTLAALIEAGHDVVAVYTQPPRPAGRGQKDRPCPVDAFARSKDLPVVAPVNLKGELEQEAFTGHRADVAVVVAYGLILPAAVLSAPRLGCFNIHASILPRWRGAAPIQRALLAGDEVSGVTIIAMDEGLDTGDMLAIREVPIIDEMTASDLHDQLAELGARMIVDALAEVAAGTATREPQPSTGVTYAAKLAKGEGRIDWREAAEVQERKVRALTPWPGVWFEAKGERVKVLSAVCEAGSEAAAPGTVLDDRLLIACGDGALRPTRLQRAGKGTVETEEFLRGFALGAGSIVD